MKYGLIAVAGFIAMASPASTQPPAPGDDKGMMKKDAPKDSPKSVPDPTSGKPPKGPEAPLKGPEFFAKDVLESKDPSIREAALRTLMAYGVSVRKTASPAIMHGLRDTDVNVYVAALQAVQSIGLEDEKDITEATKKTMDWLVSPHLQVRFEAAVATALLGNKVRKTALPHLIPLSQSTIAWQMRRAAVTAIGRVGYDDEKDMPDPLALNALLRSVKDSSYVVRREAIQSLILLGRPNKPLDLKSVQAAMAERIANDKDIGIRTWARVCVVWFEGAKLKPNYLPLVELLSQMKDSNPIARYEAFYGLGYIGKNVGMKALDVKEATDLETADYIKTVGMWALGNMGTAAELALPYLERESRTHVNPDVKAAAADAIKAINNAKGITPPPEKKKTEMKK